MRGVEVILGESEREETKEGEMRNDETPSLSASSHSKSCSDSFNMLDLPLPPSQRRVYPIPDLHPLEPSPPSLPSYTSNLSQTSQPTLCIDNGASLIRAGFTNLASPYLELENIGAKYKDRKLNTTVHLAGGEVYVDAASRSSTRVPYEGDVVCNFDVMVSLPLHFRTSSMV